MATGPPPLPLERACLIIGVLLLAGLVTIIVAERHRARSLRGSILVRRLATWSMIAPIVIAAAFLGTWAVALLATWLVVQSLRELIALLRIEAPYARTLLALGVGAPGLVALQPSCLPWLPLAFLLIVSAIPVMYDRVDGSLSQLALSGFAFTYVATTLSLLVAIREDHSLGGGGVLAITMAVAASDVLAFVLGSTMGHRRLAPHLSPGKTRAGAVGNVAGAAAGLAVMSCVVPSWTLTEQAVLAIVLGIGCVWGDLVESLLKRTAGTKDTGAVLPGFGGLLDRIDSLTVALPLSFITLRLMGA